MTGRLLRAAYALSEGARVGLFWGQSAVSTRLAPAAPRTRTPPPADSKPLRRAEVLADLRALLARDWRNIEQGLYRMPHDLFGAPLWVARAGPRYFRDLATVNRRRAEENWREVRGHPEAEAYPAYYRRNFHYQTDGYLSPESADLYDYQVEVLFGGGADAMRRQALVPLHHVVRARGVAGCRLIDLGCGTGRFLAAVKDNYPRLAVTALDLSPYYLAKARRALRAWRGTEFIQAPAEASGLSDAAFDVATCVFLFHELPGSVRAAVAREIARLLKPGGELIFLDSIQLGDHPPYDGLLNRFPAMFHEPYYAHYARQDLSALFAAAGLRTRSVERAYFSRLMVLEKPA